MFIAAEPELDRHAVVPRARVVRDQALVLLRVDLPWDQLVVDESARARSWIARSARGNR